MWPVLLPLTALLACDRPTDEAVPVGPTAEEQVVLLRSSLGQAQALWAEGQHEAAADQVDQIYVEHYLPLDPMLRGGQPVGALGLAYGFGRLSSHMRARRADEAQLAAESAALGDGVAAAVASSRAEPTP